MWFTISRASSKLATFDNSRMPFVPSWAECSHVAMSFARGHVSDFGRGPRTICTVGTSNRDHPLRTRQRCRKKGNQQTIGRPRVRNDCLGAKMCETDNVTSEKCTLIQDGFSNDTFIQCTFIQKLFHPVKVLPAGLCPHFGFQQVRGFGVQGSGLRFSCFRFVGFRQQHTTHTTQKWKCFWHREQLLAGEQMCLDDVYVVSTRARSHVQHPCWTPRHVGEKMTRRIETEKQLWDIIPCALDLQCSYPNKSSARAHLTIGIDTSGFDLALPVSFRWRHPRKHRQARDDRGNNRASFLHRLH